MVADHLRHVNHLIYLGQKHGQAQRDAPELWPQR